jgi:hypothetical protein
MTYTQLVSLYPHIDKCCGNNPTEINTLALIAQNQYFCADMWGQYQEQAIIWYLLHLFELKEISQKTGNGTISSIGLDDDGNVAFNKPASPNVKSWFEKLGKTYYGGLLLDLYNSLFPVTPFSLVGPSRGSVPASMINHSYGGYYYG